MMWAAIVVGCAVVLATGVALVLAALCGKIDAALPAIHEVDLTEFEAALRWWDRVTTDMPAAKIYRLSIPAPSRTRAPGA